MMHPSVEAVHKHETEIICALMFDKMANWPSRNTLSGMVRNFSECLMFALLLSTIDDSTPVATVLMSVCLNDTWKVPCVATF